jgi:hypothetical protein
MHHVRIDGQFYGILWDSPRLALDEEGRSILWLRMSRWHVEIAKKLRAATATTESNTDPSINVEISSGQKTERYLCSAVAISKEESDNLNGFNCNSEHHKFQVAYNA